MKSFASMLLAAAVSANYCFTDGCNCSGEYQECYSMPRQYMKPKAVPMCCGSSPTTAPTDSLSTVDTKNTSTTVNGDGTFSGNTKNQTYSWAKDANGKPVIAWENSKGKSFGFNQTSSLNWSAKQCRGWCDRNGSYPIGCPALQNTNTCNSAKAQELAAQSEATTSLMTGTSSTTWSPTAALINAETKEQYRATQTSALRWTSDRCRTMCLATGAYPNQTGRNYQKDFDNPNKPSIKPCHILLGETCASLKRSASYAEINSEKKAYAKEDADLERARLERRARECFSCCFEGIRYNGPPTFTYSAC